MWKPGELVQDNLVSVVPQLSSEANDIYLFSEMLEERLFPPCPRDPPHTQTQKEAYNTNGMRSCVYDARACLPACLPASLTVCLHACMHACMHACLHKCTQMHTDIHRCTPM